MISKAIQRFIKTEAIGGVLLLIALFVVLCVANSPLNDAYQSFIDTPIHIGFGHLKIVKPALLWVNEGLMALFFMLLALEIKREMLEGELSDIAQLTLPIVGAIGGICVPVLIFYFINRSHPATASGWPIATTTDVAFMLGIVALLGKRVPYSLKVILVALSIVDDIVAIVIIAVSYSSSLSLFLAVIACVAMVCLVLLNICGVMRIAPYMLLGLVMWVCVLQSGIHATLAGVLIGLVVPLRQKETNTEPPLRRLERCLHPWVAYFVLPIFVLFNGGVPFVGLHWSHLTAPLPLGITLGLCIGKSCGVFGCCWFVLKCKWARLPSDVSLRQLFGVSALTGIGFTMSLFLAALAFANTPYENISRQGVLLGSLLSCLLGICVLWKCHNKALESI